MGHAVKVEKKLLGQKQSADTQIVAKMAGQEDPERNSSYGHTRIISSNGTPLQYFCLKNPMDGGAWQAAVHGVVESDATE